jgi:DNA-binding transcriptional ArsR family regulator
MGDWCIRLGRVHGRHMGDLAAVASTAGRGYQLQVGPPGGLAVSIVKFPQLSVIDLLRQLASGQPAGGPAWPPAATGRALRPMARFAAWSLAGARHWPECCAPIPPVADVSVAAQAERLRDVAPDMLTDGLQALTDEMQALGHGPHAGDGGRSLTPQWQAAAQQPRRWLASMADASLDTWAALAPRWKAAAPLFDREVRRVGTAAVRGGMQALLNSLHPRISYADGKLSVAIPHDRCVALGGRRLVLLPMIARRDALVVSFERPEVCVVGYPIRPPGIGTPTVAGEALALILGPPRAAVLQALGKPLTVGELASAVQCAPTTATYHLQQLAKAGLITRQRNGTSVWISRTLRGDQLIDLLAD